MKNHLVHCFCTEKINSGNPAAVVEGFKGDSAAKQTLATQLNLPVTVFITEASSRQPMLDFFYPATEMPLCLHGTLAAAFILFKKTSVKSLVFTTRSGLLINVATENEIIQVEVAKQPIPNSAYQQDEICQMLNLTRSDIATGLPFCIASVGSPKLLVPLACMSTLANLKPNFTLIKNWSLDHKVNGLYVYSHITRNQNYFVARGFNPKTGNNEDAATGVAAAALALCLRSDIIVEQGDIVGKPCRMFISYKNEQHLLIGGKVF